ncbi:MAG: hypothetical protein JSS87_09965 [Acidobacteria bacterium]|nr:hypothetical protein [Acidobacteriota bacterium]
MTASDIRCPVCGQGILIHNAARSRDLRLLQREAVTRDLRRQHLAGGHTAIGFAVDCLPDFLPETPAPVLSSAALNSQQNLPHTVFNS